MCLVELENAQKETKLTCIAVEHSGVERDVPGSGYAVSGLFCSTSHAESSKGLAESLHVAVHGYIVLELDDVSL